jgi:Flp pilus assembly protein TadD
MPRQLLQRHGYARFLASSALSAILVLGLCSCQTDGMSDITGSLGEKAEKSHAAEPSHGVEFYRDRFAANPDDADAALQYGKALRAAGQRPQAVAVLEKATLAHPSDKALIAGYGRALADNGNFQQAFDVLSRAHTPDNPDWILRRAYGHADADPRVRQNLALVVGLRGHLAEAEDILKANRPPEEAAANIAHLRRVLSRKANARTSADNTSAIGVARPD